MGGGDCMGGRGKGVEKKGVSRGGPEPVEAMSRQDRRIGHMGLVDHGGVTTESEGEGLFRRVVIFPKRGGDQPEPV